MHGMIFAELKKYASNALGPSGWNDVLREANVEGRIFLPVQEYPDREAVSIVAAAASLTGSTVPGLLEDFGRFIVPDLLGLYGFLVPADWDLFDFLENTEDTIHRVVRARNPEARPPQLVARRLGPQDVEITYVSLRRLCALARGIVRGAADHYGTSVHVTESACMLRGAPHCKIRVTAALTAVPPARGG